jgi:Zn-dependent peptidase ImmA (M78 family)
MTKVAALMRNLSLTVDDIASRSRLPRERVDAITNGAEATLTELRALARGLRIPLRAFAPTTKSDADLAMLFRSTTANRPDLGVESAAAFVEAALAVLPARSALPDWILAFSTTGDSYEDAERLAEQFRTRYLSDRPQDPLFDLPDLMIRLGGTVLGRLETSRFEGASVISDGYAFIFVSPRFSGRMLFTLAHELGHVLAHHEARRSVVFDLASQIGGSRHRTKSEAFVDAFASVLLMPEQGVAIALREIRSNLRITNAAIGDVEILYLARFYGVSFEVAARRCENLELLPAGGAYALADHLKKTHGSAEKLAVALGLPSRAEIVFPRVSQNLLSAAAAKIEHGEVSLGWVTDHLGCSAGEIYAIRATLGGQRGNRY